MSCAWSTRPVACCPRTSAPTYGPCGSRSACRSDSTVTPAYAPEEVVEDLSRRLREERPAPVLQSDTRRLQLAVAEGTEWTATAGGLAQKVRSEAKKRGKLSVINVVAAQQPTPGPVI